MRLDKFLKVSRLIKRRTVANEACDNGRISVNSRVVKASYDVKVGDKIEISMGTRTVAVEVRIPWRLMFLCLLFSWKFQFYLMLQWVVLQ